MKLISSRFGHYNARCVLDLNYFRGKKISETFIEFFLEILGIFLTLRAVAGGAAVVLFRDISSHEKIPILGKENPRDIPKIKKC